MPRDRPYDPPEKKRKEKPREKKIIGNVQYSGEPDTGNSKPAYEHG